VVAELADELLDYEPDLLILYVGHNEFYGAFGTASTVGIGGNPTLTRLYLELTNVRTFVLLRDAIEAVVGLFRSPVKIEPGKTLMAEVIGDEAITYGSDEYWVTLEAFEENLRGIIRNARSRKVPVLVSGLVSNVRDHPPFLSAHRPDMDVEARERWDRAIAAGDSAMVRGSFDLALRHYEVACALDSTHALGLFKLAGSLLKTADTAEARRRFLAAKDCDLLRFRASEDLITRLRSLTRETATPLAAVDSAFESRSPGRLIGRELMMEHLHPTIEGYALMAETFAATMRRHGLVFGRDRWSSAMEVPAHVALRNAAVSQFDTLAGAIKIELLTHRWPFVRETLPFTYQPKDRVEEIVFRYVQGRIAWSEARYEIAEEYARAGRFEDARRECRAVAAVIPYSYHPYLRIADYYSREGKRREALQAYEHTTQVQDNPFSRLKKSVILLEDELPREARAELQRALALPGATQQLSSVQMSLAHYLLGVASAKIGDLATARASARSALQYNPESQEAADLLRQLDRISPRP
jgi:lysophospholipase L1-like esterase